jgi:hypothetical protein
MRYLIKKILKKETDNLNVINIPSLKYFNNDWNFLQEYLKSEGNPPYTIDDDLDLRYTDIKSLGNLRSVGGGLNLHGTKIESLGNIQSVGGYLDLRNSKIESLGNLRSVGGNLNLYRTPLSKKHSKEEIMQMVQVDGDIYM